MPTSEPRKLPRQGRSKATVQAILDACGELIGRHGYAQLRTHALATRAGVSVGTLYQYFPNREAVAGALVMRAMERLHDAMRRAHDECHARQLDALEGTEHLLLTGLDVLVQERTTFARLAAEAPDLFRRPAVMQIQAQLIQFPQEIRLLSAVPLDLPMPEADSWIIGHMVSASMLQISLLDVRHEQRRALTREVARLTCRMALETAAVVRAPDRSAAA